MVLSNWWILLILSVVVSFGWSFGAFLFQGLVNIFRKA